MTAKILSFTPRNHSRERPDDATALRGAILLFTGVRYERLPDVPAAKPAKPAKRRPRRVAQAL